MTVSSSHKAKGGDDLPLAISLSGVSKTFGAVRANDDISLTVQSGCIHGIVGENGAGKSTLVSILYGFYQADQGEIAVDGKPVHIRSTYDAIAVGIGMVHQHFMLVPPFSVLENIILGHEIKAGARNLKEAKAQARDELIALSETYGLTVDLDARVEDLSVGLQQRVEILKALYRGARILILDEPTGVLTPQETVQLIEVLKSHRDQGVTVLLITHKLREIMAITDHVSVMRGGKMVDHLATATTSPEELAQLMVGRKVLVNANYHDATPAGVQMQVSDLTLTGASGMPLLRGISFDLKAGEILGVAGVSGNGQSELLEVLSGITAPTQGQVTIGSTVISPEAGLSPRDIKALGVAHVPEDRHAMGMVLPFTAAESAALGYEDQPALGTSMWFRPAAIEDHCASLMRDYDIRPGNPKLKSNLFSGGNQQKLVLAREMSAAPRILLVGQPTRGVDIGAIEFIHQQLIDMRDQGCAILLISVELDEILSLSDRVMVMNAGQSMGIVNKADANAQSIGLMMAGVQ
ncbi:MAG: ABC transporter ATP-binding protein [Alphaproteobacteria bacterium]|nr:ABC transporter ATP-binding protein [Alphaproteobacteria bacterium]